MDTAIAHARFEQSAWIARIWPNELLAPTLRYFPVQHEINHVLVSGPGQLAAALPTIHSLLTRSQLKTLPLWMLASNEPRQLAAQSALANGKADAQAHWELALGALAERDYARAHALFLRAGQGGAYGPRVEALSSIRFSWRPTEVALTGCLPTLPAGA
jgi:hypothetical protein